MTDKLLYKYRSIDEDIFHRDLMALKDNYFWASDIEHLNDDRECFFNEKMLLNILDYLDKIYHNNHKNIDDVKVQMNELFEKIKYVGIFSLSRDPHIPSMWALYGSERKGYCIIYREEKLMEYTNGVYTGDKNKLDVVYTKSVPTLSIQDFHKKQMLVKLVATKEQSWSAEKETRIITDNYGKHEIASSALYGIIFGSQIRETDKQKIKDALIGRNVKFYQLRHKENDYGYEHVLVDEYKIPSSLNDDMYDFINHNMPTVDNYFVKLNFVPSQNDEIRNFLSEFKKKHTDRQCNIYIYDKYVDMEMFNDDYKNYDYLQRHLIAEVYMNSNEVLFNNRY